MSNEESFLSISIRLIKEASVESIVQWVSSLHNIFAPGFLYLYMFKYKEFNELSFFKLLLLAFVLSVPITYIFYLIVGNLLRISAVKKGTDQASLRISALIGITVLVVALDIAIFITGTVLS